MEPTLLPVTGDGGFEAVYRSEVHALSALAASLVGDPERGAEIAHEALLRAFRSGQKVGHMDRPGAWVRRVTINLAIDATRRRRREARMAPRLLASASPEGSPAGVGVDDPFWHAVRGLPERQRAIVALRYVEDMSLEDIARTLEIAVGTVKSALNAAKATLAFQLGEEEDADGHH